MTKTGAFKTLVQQHVATGPAFADALLREGIETLLTGDLETGRTILSDYIRATVGFDESGSATGAAPRSLMRMLGPRGNPHAKKLLDILGYLQQQAGVQVHVTTTP